MIKFGNNEFVAEKHMNNHRDHPIQFPQNSHQWGHLEANINKIQTADTGEVDMHSRTISPWNYSKFSRSSLKI